MHVSLLLSYVLFPLFYLSVQISQDFVILHPEASLKLAETWVPVYSEKILKLASKER